MIHKVPRMFFSDYAFNIEDLAFHLRYPLCVVRVSFFDTTGTRLVTCMAGKESRAKQAHYNRQYFWAHLQVGKVCLAEALA
jgi:hypothetical protein